MNTNNSYWQVIESKGDLEILKEMAREMTLEELAHKLNMSMSKTYNVLRYKGLKPKHKEVIRKKKEKIIKPKKDHELTEWASYTTKGKIRDVYYNMLKRCYNPKVRGYSYYGGRGITVCDEWKSDCCNFYRWARDNGYKENLQLDRIDTNGNYSPENCRFITVQENSYNKRCTRKVTYKGKTLNLLEWEKETGINKVILADRIFKYKWSVERALTQKVKTDTE